MKKFQHLHSTKVFFQFTSELCSITLEPISPNHQGLITNTDPIKRMKSCFGSRASSPSLIHVRRCGFIHATASTPDNSREAGNRTGNMSYHRNFRIRRVTFTLKWKLHFRCELTLMYVHVKFSFLSPMVKNVSDI